MRRLRRILQEVREWKMTVQQAEKELMKGRTKKEMERQKRR